MKIIIDSGHGGTDPGALGFGMTEKQLNPIFASLLASKLKKKGFDVDSSLIQDIYYSSDEISSLIKASKAQLCISCHNNAVNGKARGLEVIHSIHSDGKLANKIIEETSKLGYITRSAFSRQSTTNKGSDYYYIIRLTYPQVETIIVEFGFIDNKEDFALISDPVWQDKLTTVVADSVYKLYGTQANPQPLPSNNKTPIGGFPILSSEVLKTAILKVNPAFNSSIVDSYYKIADIYGVKADLAIIQAIIETNWFKFTGIVAAYKNNFAGLGALGGTNTGEAFPSIEAGIEAHIQHLYAYSTVNPIPTGRVLYDNRIDYVKRGIAPYWEDLNGKWAVPGTNYAQTILSLYKKMAEQKSADIIVTPPDVTEPPAEDNESSNDGSTAPDEKPRLPPTSQHWAKPCNDELLSLGLLNNDHSNTLNDPATEGMVICLINRLRKELKKNG